MTPADMRARADWLHTWYDEKTTPAMLRAGADAIEEVERLREVLMTIENNRTKVVRVHDARAIAASALTPQEPNHD